MRGFKEGLQVLTDSSRDTLRVQVNSQTMRSPYSDTPRTQVESPNMESSSHSAPAPDSDSSPGYTAGRPPPSLFQGSILSRALSGGIPRDKKFDGGIVLSEKHGSGIPEVLRPSPIQGVGLSPALSGEIPRDEKFDEGSLLPQEHGSGVPHQERGVGSMQLQEHVSGIPEVLRPPPIQGSILSRACSGGIPRDAKFDEGSRQIQEHGCGTPDVILPPPIQGSILSRALSGGISIDTKFDEREFSVMPFSPSTSPSSSTFSSSATFSTSSAAFLPPRTLSGGISRDTKFDEGEFSAPFSPSTSPSPSPSIFYSSAISSSSAFLPPEDITAPPSVPQLPGVGYIRETTLLRMPGSGNQPETPQAGNPGAGNIANKPEVEIPGSGNFIDKSETGNFNQIQSGVGYLRAGLLVLTESTRDVLQSPRRTISQGIFSEPAGSQLAEGTRPAGSQLVEGIDALQLGSKDAVPGGNKKEDGVPGKHQEGGLTGGGRKLVSPSLGVEGSGVSELPKQQLRGDKEGGMEGSALEKSSGAQEVERSLSRGLGALGEKIVSIEVKDEDVHKALTIIGSS